MGVEDVIIRKAAAPGIHSYLSSVPGGGQEYDLLNPNAYPQHDTPQQEQEYKIDPSLMGQEHGVHGGGDFGDLYHPEGVYFGGSQHGDPQWQGHYNPHDLSMHFLNVPHRAEHMPIQDPHMHVLRGSQEGWQVESLDAGPEFDKWMDEE